MELKLLDSVIHGVLKPWKIDTSNTKRFTELVKAAKAASPKTNQELHAQLTALLTDYPTLQKILAVETIGDAPMHSLLYSSNLPKYKDAVTHFYYIVITGETHRVFNTVLQQAVNWTELVDIRYQVGKNLTNVRVLAKQVTIELNEQGFTTVPDAQSSLVHFTLYYLKHSLIQLYFSVQKAFESSLQQVTTLEDFYLLDLEEPLSNLLQLEFAEQPVEPGGAPIENNVTQGRFTFGFTGDKERLKTTLALLCQKIDLLNEERTPNEILLAVLISKDLGRNQSKIHLGCETAQFRYIIDKMASQFTNLKLTAIEKTGSFYSKNGILITAQNLSSGKVNNPKQKGTIDSILKQLQ